MRNDDNYLLRMLFIAGCHDPTSSRHRQHGQRVPDEIQHESLVLSGEKVASIVNDILAS